MRNEDYTLNIKVNKSINLNDMPYPVDTVIKLAFLIWQVNKHVEYTLFADKVSKLMDISDAELNEYLTYLIGENIIRVAAVTSKDKTVYMMVAPYSMAKRECWNLCFAYEGESTPAFISRFIADGYSYKNPSGYIPGLPLADYPKPVSVSERMKDERIKELDAELANYTKVYSTLINIYSLKKKYLLN
jgi:hypothetical protein